MSHYVFFSTGHFYSTTNSDATLLYRFFVLISWFNLIQSKLVQMYYSFISF